MSCSSLWRRAAGMAAVAVVLGAPARADLPETQARGVLRVLVVQVEGDNEFFAFPYKEAAPGFDREVLEGFARLHSVRVEPVVLTSWDALIPALLEGKGDVIAGRFTVTDTRKKQIAFTSEVFPTRNVVMTRKPHRLVASLEQFQQEKVGTIKGTSMAEAVARANVPRSNVDDSFPPGGLPEALQSGKATAVVLGLESAIVAQRHDSAIQIGLFLGTPGSLAYGVRKSDAALLGALNEYVENVRRTPTWNRLVLKYFGESALEILRRARN